ncbi:SIR2 family NAD-dependent protein deacylase [Flavisolibacter ginsengisoli]|jgi:NAD-dependent deacetylase|uniref:NAD-dependent protein deacylase n=1 Tax=Flavisolibacter ginsengisoli DSM 18119 TaxID=1121884 RepID=A0A1M4WRM8_9BACT|nr:NAD-dependent deacylase [Flavisolibacter ginsengisoli]SHE83874.1 NAD-dependent deacetylase [Flavisolibacter ginsengisoli DSM 18119]
MEKKKLVVLTGAGISAESGLKTFRDSDGLWEGYDINEVATATAWRRNPALVLEFYNARRKSVINAKPNAAHYALAELEKDFNVTIITQNIDDLHERAGSGSIIHLHGEILKMRSERNENLIYPIQDEIQIGDVAEDGHQLRPHIVWFEEAVPMMEDAIEIAKTADIFLIVGTSLVVYPAAGLLHYVPHNIPKFIVDKKIPFTNQHNFVAIEKLASEGMQELSVMLAEYK